MAQSCPSASFSCQGARWRAPSFLCGNPKGTRARMDDQAWYLRTSKLALALAIIHSKPADKSSREHTEHLARVVSGQESQWSSKVEALEAEVLQLRQKLLLSSICAGSFKNGDSLLHTQEPRSSENTLTFLEDSGCDLSNEQKTEASEMSQHSVESCAPLLFPPLPILKGHCATLQNPLSSHMQFLQRLLQLKCLTEPGSVKTDLSHFSNNSSTVSDSVLRLLDGLITFYRKPKFPFSSFWTEAVDTLANLINDSTLSNHIFKKCYKKLEEFEKTLLQVILKNNQINRFQVQHCLSQNLVTLGSCSLLRKSIISLLLSEVNGFADDLGTFIQAVESMNSSGSQSSMWLMGILQTHCIMITPFYHLFGESLEGYMEQMPTQSTLASLMLIGMVQTSYDVARYENMFSLFWVLEQLLLKETKEGNNSDIGHNDQEIKKFLHKHDEIIFQLSDTFPLFTFYLWRLGILLNSEGKET